MFTIIIFFIVLSILVLVHECGHFIMAKRNGVKVEEFGFGLPPRIFGIRIGETLYSLNVLPFGGFVKVLGEEEAELKDKKLTPGELKRSFSNKKPWQKSIILVGGVLFNFILGWIIISYLFTKGVPVPANKVVVEEVIKNSPAEKILQKGDIVRNITYNGSTIGIKKVEDISDATKKYGGKEILIVISRKNQNKTIAVTPRTNPPKGQGSLGILISDYEIKKYSVIEAPFLGLVEAAKMTGIIFKELAKTLVKFVTFQKQDAQIAGPVGIARITSQAAKAGLDPLLQMIGLLSLNLSVINILPFPALDGGRLALVIYEWISKRKVNPEVERKMNLVGFTFLISLIILVTIQDIIKIFK